ncbi:MAG: carboxy-S-adenosyl-L-methionine synthase CmoA [Mariprofundaceae bacterium]|nr:carboxy-S-adenosyl-L-methionine synthase CmoA [Mariprofundaceae bacterium]
MTIRRIDKLYEEGLPMPSRFQFDAQVAGVFADMIARSVPGYGLTLDMIGIIAARYAWQKSTLYDLGSSLGASTLAMRHAVTGRGCHIIAVDSAAAMQAQCQTVLAEDTASTRVSLLCADVCAIKFSSASVVVLNFTLQFIPLSERLPLLKRIATAIGTDGVLILSEKISFDDSWQDATQQSLHEAFKARQGYSQLEISRKREALEDILLPETLKSHKKRLHAAGFMHVCVWFQCLNFVSLLAFRGR